ncbi:atherin-like [Choloepus didactylus]|uniref:atherin-like n=1 Tax=Choloepus didactylus TaxID=27675 RepID=UPI0018A093DC|nr:atherin-like [Choloepus didactylus]
MADEEVRPMPLKLSPLPMLSPYRAPCLASNRCSFSVASMRPRAPAAPPSAPSKLRAGWSAALALLRGKESPRRPADPSLAPAAPARAPRGCSLRRAPTRVPAAPGPPLHSCCSGSARPALPPLGPAGCARRSPRAPPALSRPGHLV